MIDAAAQLDDAHRQWVDSTSMPDDVVEELLVTAWDELVVYLPGDAVATPPIAEPPPRWVKANVLHARDLWAAGMRNGDVIGFDAFAVTVRPLSRTVATLLRPPRGRPLVG